MIGTGQAAASDSSPVLLAATPNPSPVREFLKNLVIFLVLSGVGGYVWYFGLFPRLLRKKSPSWPLDAWRLASYGAWLTVCASLFVFRDQFYKEVLIPLLTRTGLDPKFISWLPVVVVLPLIALVGLLVIWNFRRDETNRAAGLTAVGARRLSSLDVWTVPRRNSSFTTSLVRARVFSSEHDFPFHSHGWRRVSGLEQTGHRRHRPRATCHSFPDAASVTGFGKRKLCGVASDRPRSC